MGVDFSFPNLLYEGLILAYVKGSQYLSTTWVMGYIFIGSFLSYGVLLLFGKMKNRIPAYIGLFVFFFVFDQMYLCFLAGIIAADIVKSRQLRGSSAMSQLVSGSLIVGGLLIGFIPDLILPKPLQVYTLAAAGAALLIVGLSGAKAVQHFLENRILKGISGYSFSAILIHMPIMAVVSCRQYLIMADLGIAKGVIILSVFIAAIPVQVLAAFLFRKLVDLISLPVSGCTAR